MSGADVLPLIVAMTACLAIGAAGAAVTAPRLGSWYRTLRKPTWNPPDRVFGPVWTALFLLMAVAAWLVWRASPPSLAVWRMAPFAVQLALNFAWSGIFFGLRRPGLAIVEMAALWLAIVLTVAVFAVASKTAALLMLPYLGWVSFAWILNLRIWALNR